MWSRWCIVLVLVFAVGCSPEPKKSDGIQVVVGFYPLAEMAQRIGGEGVSVRNLTPAGAEPHDLELSSDDLDEIIDADLVLYLGSEFQPALSDAIDQSDGRAVDVLLEVNATTRDPHVWLDPVQWSRAVPVVADAFARVDPEHALEYNARARPYRVRLGDLNGSFKKGLSDCESDLLVTNHAAFGHLAARYGLRQVSVTGVSPEAEPDPERLAEVTDLVQSEGVTTIFTETLLPADVAETVAREAGAKTAILNPIEGLTSDQAEQGDDYVSLMQDNLAALRKGLRCA